MNEQHFTIELRRALDESAEKLPYRVSHRLAGAREAALARISPAVRVNLSVSGVSTLMSASVGGRGAGMDEPSLLSRWAGIVIPVLIVLAGLLSIAYWDDSEKAEELADIDEQVLTDDVPISAYADRGFGVFLKNSRQ